MRNVASVVAVSLAVTVASAAALAGCGRGGGGTADGGPLTKGLYDQTLGLAVAFRKPMTLGLTVLENVGDKPAVLDDVRPVSSAKGLRMLGVTLATRKRVTTDGDHPGFPPPDYNRDALRSVAGTVVVPAREERKLPGLPGTQVLLGYKVIRRGRWKIDGLRVSYHIGRQRYDSLIRDRAYICAPRPCNSDAP